MPLKYTYLTAFRQAVRFFADTAEIAGEYDICIMIEPLNFNSANFCNTIHQAVDIIHGVSAENMYLLVDFFHMLMMAEPFCRIEQYGSLIGHVHICGRDGQDKRRVIVRDDLDMCREALACLKNCGYDKTVSLEVPFDLVTEGSLTYFTGLLKGR